MYNEHTVALGTQYNASKPKTMPYTARQRFAISMPTGMAVQIDEACRVEGCNRSDFLKEAVRHYAARLASKPPQFAVPTTDAALQEAPFRLFADWSSEADAVYDVLR